MGISTACIQAILAGTIATANVSDHIDLEKDLVVRYPGTTFSLPTPKNTADCNLNVSKDVPTSKLKAGRETRQQLKDIGVFRQSGQEHFAGSLVVPVVDENNNVLEVYGLAGLGLALDLLLHPVVVLLHEHKYGAYAAQAGDDKRRGEINTRRNAQQHDPQEEIPDLSHRRYLLGQGKLLNAVFCGLYLLPDQRYISVEFFRVGICKPDMIVILAGICGDGFSGPDIIPQRSVKNIPEHTGKH